MGTFDAGLAGFRSRLATVVIRQQRATPPANALTFGDDLDTDQSRRSSAALLA
jgi:hypothetical protein